MCGRDLGLELLEARGRLVDEDAPGEQGPRVPGALVTADGSDEVKREARARGYRVLTKPIKPASLRAFLAAQRSAHVAGHGP